MSDTTTHVIHGKAHWAKIVGPARMNNYDEKEWSIDVTPDAEGLDLLKKLGLSDRLRDPREGDKRTERFIAFRHKALKADGSPADPIRIVDAKAEKWPEGRLIGNESEVNVKFVVKDYGKGKKKGVYIRAVQVVNLVPYEVRDFAPVESDESFFAAEGEGRLPDGMEPQLEDDLNDDFPE